MLARIVDTAIDRVGDWNPQLFRELKARISPRTILATVSLSLGSELLVLGMVGTQGLVNFNNWINAMAILAGIYFLISDVARERKSGTFDFIKLTPQSGRSIFIGKLLGTPILIYLISLTICAVQAVLLLSQGISVNTIAGWLLSLGAIYYAAFSTAILLAAVGHRSAIISTIFIYPFISCLLLTNNIIIFLGSGNGLGIHWYFFDFRNSSIFGLFVTVSCWIWSYWCWVGIDRKYVNISNSLFTKKNNYFFNFCFNCWLFGFCVVPFIDAFGVRSFDSIVYVSHICNFLSAAWIGIFQSWAIPRPVINPQWQRIEFMPVEREYNPAIANREKNIIQAFFPTDESISEDILLFVNSLYYGIFWSLPMILTSPLTLWYQIFICIFINLFISMAVWISSFAIYTLIFNRKSFLATPLGGEERQAISEKIPDI